MNNPFASDCRKLQRHAGPASAVLMACATIITVLMNGAQTTPQEVATRDVAPAFKLQVERNLVTVRVVVRNGKGEAVDNLRQEDFQLFDRGKKQTIETFSVEKPALNAEEVQDAVLSTNEMLGLPIRVNTQYFMVDKTNAEMDEYYLLGYAPPHPGQDGACHKIQVKVDRSGAEVRARNGYSEPKGPDLLAGKTEGVTLEAKATNSEAGEIPLTLRVPYFYVRPGVARVDLALSIPGSAIDFEKQKGNFQSQIDVMGIAYRDDNSVAARFSDTVIASPLNAADIDPALIEGSVPMVANGMQLVPSSSNHFKVGSEPIVYVEVYDPILQSGNPQLGILFDIVNWKNNQKVFSSITIPITEYAHPGNPLVPVIFKMPIEKLPAGDYALRIWARDSAQNISPVQAGTFFIEN